MKLHELQPAEGSKQTPRRVGRGIGSGLGKTSGKGHKGQKARSGGGKGPYFEGGQTPLQRRMPKRGFSNARFKVEYTEVNVGLLDRFDAEAVITPEFLIEQGLVKQVKNGGVKILGNGEVTKAFKVQTNAISQAAQAKIEAAGGSVEVI
ncbi:MAG: 50S ribosomal protein L15 [Clostridiales bacterium]|nr:MAG: 50S ribosomal protein L15 [Clostridiales bacterium]